MSEKNKKIAIGIGLAIGIYLVITYVGKKYFIKKVDITSGKPDSSFTGFGGESSGYVAKFYDAEHQNEDGSKGATWIAFNDSPIVGFWKKGKVKEGTLIHV